MNTDVAKLIAIAILGGVVKTLFGPPRPPITNVHNHTPRLATLPPGEQIDFTKKDEDS